MVFYSCLRKYTECFKQANELNLKVAPLPHIIISNVEHDSVKCIADHYRNENFAEITEIEINEDGLFNVSDVIALIRPNTILISIMLANNETGVLLVNRLKLYFAHLYSILMY
jgi:cysteine sulfinate desulfinase/cysteine desulfurase-like protein